MGDLFGEGVAPGPQPLTVPTQPILEDALNLEAEVDETRAMPPPPEPCPPGAPMRKRSAQDDDSSSPGTPDSNSGSKKKRQRSELPAIYVFEPEETEMEPDIAENIPTGEEFTADLEAANLPADTAEVAVPEVPVDQAEDAQLEKGEKRKASSDNEVVPEF